MQHSTDAVLYVSIKSGRANRTLDYMQRVVDIFSQNFNCTMKGHDASSKEEWLSQAEQVAKQADYFFVAGGDGALHDIVNTVDRCVIGILPYGSGNGVARNFYDIPHRRLNIKPKELFAAAEQIRDGKEHDIDLILCNNKEKAFFAGVGVDGPYFEHREEIKKNLKIGSWSYVVALFKQIHTTYELTHNMLEVDGDKIDVPEALEVVVTKAPIFGSGVKLVPEAKMDDGYVHLKYFQQHKIDALINLLKVKFGLGTPPGYIRGKEVKMHTSRPLWLETDGTLIEKVQDFSFKVLPKAVQMRY